MKYLVILSIFVLAGFCLQAQNAALIPQPVKMHKSEGQFTFTQETKILLHSANKELNEVAILGSEMLKQTTGLGIEIAAINFDSPEGNILAQLNAPFDPEIGTEGYKLQVKNDGIFVNANSVNGIFYGFETLAQMLFEKTDAQLDCVEITDYPRFSWRGMHLDVSRHFMPAEFIYKFIDYIAMHKMNVFHWHLIDDQGWRIEIKKYPKLTEVGAWRVDREDHAWNSREAMKKGEKATYGGFYSQEEVKAIVEYARKKQVTIVPEIEMPAHVMSGLAAYPEFSCTGEDRGVPPGGVWPITHIFCAGKDATFAFLEDVLSETMELFPSTYIHVGGDEADKTEWKKCSLCQKRIQDEGLKDEHELQSYFIERIEKFLNSKGRRLIGWDEILEGGLAPEATVMSWRGEKGGIEAAKMGNNVVMTPGSHCYFDHYQGDPELEPMAWGGFTTLKKVYSYEPIPAELTADEGKLVLGAQANVWTEFMPDGKQVEYMVLPRMAALAEVVWSPKENKNWEDFSARMETQYERYEKLGANYSTSAFQVTAFSELDPETRSVKVSFASEASNPEIRYTTDGSNPRANSNKFTEPFSIDKTTEIKAIVFKNGKAMSKAMASKFFIHKAVACPLQLKFPNSKSYDSTGEFSLVDGIKGTVNHDDGRWKGFNGNDLLATIDMGKVKSFSMVSVGANQNVGAWIFYPTEVLVEVSNDGKNFKAIGKTQNKVSVKEGGRLTRVFSVKKNAKARYVRVTAKNLGVCPKGHGGEGQPAWMFIDEIVVE